MNLSAADSPLEAAIGVFSASDLRPHGEVLCDVNTPPTH